MLFLCLWAGVNPHVNTWTDIVRVDAAEKEKIFFWKSFSVSSCLCKASVNAGGEVQTKKLGVTVSSTGALVPAATHKHFHVETQPHRHFVKNHHVQPTTKQH